MNTSGPPPDALVRSLVEGPSPVSAVEWHPSATSTNALAAAAAARGAEEIHVVLADEQTAGRGRLDRGWQAPPGTSLLSSYVLRPPPARAVALPLLPLVAGVALVDAAAPHCPGVALALKWPNDLLADGRKAAGILAETRPDGAVVLGVGVNVDWRGVVRDDALGTATSLAEARGGAVDRWRLLAAFVGVLGNRYRGWAATPTSVLDAYRARCATLGQTVRVDLPDGGRLMGTALDVTPEGRLVVAGGDGRTHRLSAGDVGHVRAT